MFDILTSGYSFQSHLCTPRIELLLYGKAPHGPSVVNLFLRKCNFEYCSPGKGRTHFIKATIATVELDVSILHKEGDRSPGLPVESKSESQGLQSLDDDSLNVDEKENLRRRRISMANKGNVPWNKGRRHSQETLRRIRERTKMAMQDPKVKMKLMNLGHAQSEETRIKIGAGVREGWQRRREMLVVQESCLFLWQNIVAEAARKGYGSEDEMQWDSYKVIDEHLKKEWLESTGKRKTVSRPKGSKRAPKSAEQRRKISEAISAKWADPEYRGRVCSALSKYHGAPVGVGGKRRRRRPSSGTSLVKRERVQRKPDKNENTESLKKGTAKSRRNKAPSYKDPMASSKLEMIRRIRAERLVMETKKKEATERAKLLIAEAEKAAKALEVAAMKSPLAQASLIETRKLIAEAIRSIESIDSGQLQSHASVDEDPLISVAPLNSHYQCINVSDHSEKVSSHLGSSDERKCVDFAVDRFALPWFEPSYVSAKDLQVGQPKINGFRKNIDPRPESKETSKSEEGERHEAAKTKSWVCGKLVEVNN